jgi:hypothetical protein
MAVIPAKAETHSRHAARKKPSRNLRKDFSVAVPAFAGMTQEICLMNETHSKREAIH